MRVWSGEGMRGETGDEVGSEGNGTFLPSYQEAVCEVGKTTEW